MPALRACSYRPALQPGFPVTIGPEDEPRPGYSAQVFIGDATVCEDCNGTGKGIDTDGSVTGRVGALIVCSCAGGAW